MIFSNIIKKLIYSPIYFGHGLERPSWNESVVEGTDLNKQKPNSDSEKNEAKAKFVSASSYIEKLVAEPNMLQDSEFSTTYEDLKSDMKRLEELVALWKLSETELKSFNELKTSLSQVEEKAWNRVVEPSEDPDALLEASLASVDTNKSSPQQNEAGADTNDNNKKEIFQKFLKENNTETSRLKASVVGDIDINKIKSWEVKSIELKLPEWVEWQLASLIMPREISEIKVWEDVYKRRSLDGEFINEKDVMLTLLDWKVEFWEPRKQEDIDRMAGENQKKANEYLKNNPNANHETILVAVNRGDPEKVLEALSSEYKKANSEMTSKEAAEDISRELANTQNIFWEYLSWASEPKTLLQFIMHTLGDAFKDSFPALAEKLWISREEASTYSNEPVWKIDFNWVEPWNRKELANRTANALGISPKIIWAIIQIESTWNASATRLEKNYVDRRTQKLWWNREEWKIAATSFWLFQIMWWNYKELWFSSPSALANFMKQSEANQFEAFSRFVQTKPALLAAMRTNPPNYEKIAFYYNWAGYARNNYDNRLRSAVNASRY